MKTKYMIAAFALAFSGAVAAAQGGEANNTGCNGVGNANSPCGGNVGGGGGAGGGGGDGGAGGSAHQFQKQQQQQQQGQQQGQSSVNINKANADSASSSKASAKNDASNDGNAQAITFNQPGTVDYSGGYTVKSAPGFAIGGPASGPCNGFSGGAALSVLGGGGAINFSKVDEGCEERETARIAALMGRMDIANLVLEEMDVVKRAQKRREEAKAAQQPAKKAEAPTAPRLVAASTQITPVQQTSNICAQAKRDGDSFLASRLNCPK